MTKLTSRYLLLVGIALAVAMLLVPGMLAAGEATVDDSGDLQEEELYELLFTSGTYEYQCTPHNWMTGTITVSEDANISVAYIIEIVENKTQFPNQSGGFSFDPVDLEVQPGTKITWVLT